MIKYLNKLLLFIIVCSSIIIFSSCKSNNYNSNNDIVNVSVNINFDTVKYKGYIYISKMTPTKLLLQDSILVTKKDVHFSLHPTQIPEIFLLTFKNNDFITLVLNDKSAINIKIKNSEIKNNYEILGSNDSRKIQEINTIIQQHENYLKENYAEYYKAPENIRQHIDSLLVTNETQMRDEITNKILQNTKSLVSLICIYSRFGNSNIFHEERDLKLFNTISDSLIIAFPNNTHAIGFHEKIDAINEQIKRLNDKDTNLNTGHIFPYSPCYTLENSIYNIENCKSKYKIIYFWKSDTPNFKIDSQKLLSFYKNKSQKDFQVIAFSFEKDKLIWNKTCKTENFDWINLITDPMIEQQINPKSIYPQYFLLDKTNKIIARESNIDSFMLCLKKL